MLLDKNFDDIDQSTILALKDAGATESVQLEFKRETYGNSDEAKKEFLKDISSFANTLGGHLVIGIEDDQGSASNICPLKDTNIDAELQRLESIVQTGVEPPIIGLRMKRVPVDGGDIIVIHVPRSYNPPHRLNYKTRKSYHMRNSSSVYEPSVEELRMLFGQQRSIEERAKTFINERILRIQAGDGALPLPSDRGTLVIHLLPLADFGSAQQREIALLRQHERLFRPMGASGYHTRPNLDGYVVFRGGSSCHGYTQIFRDGSIEATSASICSDQNGIKKFGAQALPRLISRALTIYLEGLKSIHATPPIILQISFYNMNDVYMGVDPMHFDTPPPFERNELLLPSSLISDYAEEHNYEKYVSDQMNFLWNVYGFDECHWFDTDGKWIGEVFPPNW